MSTSALLVDPSTRVTCPHCAHEFSLADGFARKSLEALQLASSGELDRLQAEARAGEERRARERASQGEVLLREKLKGHEALLDAQRRQHAESLERVRVLEREGSARREAELRASLEHAAARAAERAAADRVQIEEQLRAQQAQLAQFHALELQLRKERETLEQRQQQLELDVQRRLDQERHRIAESVRTAESERARLREAELQKKLDDTLSKLGDTQRQLEQGSQQLQGEVLELILEEDLAAAFPFDVVSEVRKGVRGADACQRVVTRSGQEAGTILWEAKRAQKWSAQWPAKLRADMREAGAEVGVIVTTCFPADWPDGQPFGLYDEVWVTGSGPAIALATALRTGLLEAFKARIAAANKGEKMEAIYDYLTAPQFAHKLRAVYDAFRKMREELESERTTMQQRWKRREKQIQLATHQLVAIAGDLQGLAQQDLPQLELEPKALEDFEPELEDEEQA